MLQVQWAEDSVLCDLGKKSPGKELWIGFHLKIIFHNGNLFPDEDLRRSLSGIILILSPFLRCLCPVLLEI